MQNLITTTIENAWKSYTRTKRLPSGWIAGNAVCCHNNGHSQDKKCRGGLLIHEDGFTWHCFNCGFVTGYSPGSILGIKTKRLFKWLGLDDTEIGKLNLFALANKEDQPEQKWPEINLSLRESRLPEGSVLIKDLLSAEFADPNFLLVTEYLKFRKINVDWFNFYWTDHPS